MTFDERDTGIVIRHVPAEVCGNCGQACIAASRDPAAGARLRGLSE